MKPLTLSIIGSLLLSGLLLAVPVVLAGNDEEGEVSTEIELLEPLPGDPIDMGERTAADGGTTICGAICLIEQIVAKVYIFGTALVSAVAVLWIIVGGYEIMFSGISDQMSAGKEKITQALLGLTLVFLAALIMHTINPGFFTFQGGTAENADPPGAAQQAPAEGED